MEGIVFIGNDGCGFEGALADVQIAPAQQCKVEAACTEMASEDGLIVGMAAEQCGQRGGNALGLLFVHAQADLIQRSLHHRNADGLEDIIIHGGLDGALGILEIRIAGHDDDVQIGLDLPGLEGKGDAIHARHIDIGQQ